MVRDFRGLLFEGAVDLFGSEPVLQTVDNAIANGLQGAWKVSNFQTYNCYFRWR